MAFTVVTDPTLDSDLMKVLELAGLPAMWFIWSLFSFN